MYPEGLFMAMWWNINRIKMCLAPSSGWMRLSGMSWSELREGCKAGNPALQHERFHINKANSENDRCVLSTCMGIHLRNSVTLQATWWVFIFFVHTGNNMISCNIFFALRWQCFNIHLDCNQRTLFLSQNFHKTQVHNVVVRHSELLLLD